MVFIFGQIQSWIVVRDPELFQLIKIGMNRPINDCSMLSSIWYVVRNQQVTSSYLLALACLLWNEVRIADGQNVKSVAVQREASRARNAVLAGVDLKTGREERGRERERQ